MLRKKQQEILKNKQIMLWKAKMQSPKKKKKWKGNTENVKKMTQANLKDLIVGNFLESLLGFWLKSSVVSVLISRTDYKQTLKF